MRTREKRGRSRLWRIRGRAMGLEAEVAEEEVVFDHERLDVYRAARELVVLVSSVLKRNVSRDLRDQTERSCTSILFNIAEGAGKTSRADKQRFYEIARGSATETAAQLDVLHIRGFIAPDQYRTARHLLLRIIQMLSKMAGGTRST
jgi:four helix bundle protein